jgi:hypothetical protein
MFLTTASVCDKMSAMVMMAGSAKRTAYRNPRLKNTIMRTAKQTTKTNQNGTVIVTLDRNPNEWESRCGADVASGRRGFRSLSTSIVFITRQALCSVGRHWLIDVKMRRKLSHKKVFAQLLWSDYSIAFFGGLKSRVDPAHHKARVKRRYHVRVGAGMRRRGRGQRVRIRGFGGGGGGRCADALRGMLTHNRGRWRHSSDA